MSPIRLLLCSLFCLLLSACGQAPAPDPSQSQSGARRKPQIGLVLKTMTNPYFVSMEQGARRAAREYGVQLIVRSAAAETSVEQQNQLLSDLIEQKVDAIVFAPSDSMRLIPQLKRAQQAGIKLVNIDNRLNPDGLAHAGMHKLPFVGVNNEKAAYEAVRHLLAPFKGPARAAILEGLPIASNAQERLRGARRALAEKPQIKLVASVVGNWRIDDGRLVMKQILQKNPQLDALFCANDMMALGAMQAMQEEGRKEIRIAGYDGLDDVRKAVRDGKVAATVDQQPDLQGYHGVRLAYLQLQGQTVPASMEIPALLVLPP
ncbi:substrate-binding domain-containing protein [Massilia sp. W12]|uniref:substrate-binding domain-containing protein n=1 Tax=Massilia sp. W12 TaxID=3126507 RepID=UPI0030CE5BDB